MTVETPDRMQPGLPEDFESTGNAELDERLSKPILRGDVGIDTAQVWMSAFLIFMVGLICWAGIFRTPFQADDQRFILENTALHSLVTLPDALMEGGPQPLTLATLGLNWALAPQSAFAMRLVSLALHLLSGLLLFNLCRRLLPDAPPVVAMVAGMMFVLHPLATQSLLYASARGPLLATTLSLGALLYFLRAVKCQSSETEGAASLKAGALVASLFCFMFALLADASAALVPMLILALHWTVRSRTRVALRPTVHVPFWALLLGMGVLNAATRGLVLPWPGPRLFAQYARMTVAPFGLSVVHDISRMPLVLGVVVLLAFGLVALLLLSRRTPGGFALFWVFAAVCYAALMRPAVVEHRAYLALAGIGLLVPWLYGFAKEGLRPAGGIAAAALVLISGVSAYMRTTTWRDEFILWQDAAIKAPHSPVPSANIGRLLVNQAEFSKSAELAVQAEKYLSQAVQHDAKNVEPRLLLGRALTMQGKLDQAIEQYQEVLQADLMNRAALLASADLLFDLGQGEQHSANARQSLNKAIELYRKADASSPLNALQLARMGAALSQLGQLEAAESVLTRAAALTPQDKGIALSLKNVSEAHKRSSGVQQQALALLKKNSADPAGLKIAAQAQVMRGDVLGASYSLDSIWRAGAGDFQVWVLDGFVRGRLGATDTFLLHHATPPAKPADVRSAWMELARACAGSGMWQAAEVYLKSDAAAMEQGELALVSLADLALQLQQASRAQAYLDKAREQNPNAPSPLLRLAAMAGAAKDTAAAAEFLAEAEKRGAPAGAVEELRKKYGVSNDLGSVRTVIQ